MPAVVIAVVLLAALLHATWNLLVRSGKDPLLDALLVAVAASAASGAICAVVPLPARESWPFIVASAAVHTGYFVLLAEAYRDGDFGPAYTVMRGTAPLLVALSGAAGVSGGEALAPRTWLGVAAICVGVLWMAALARGRSGFPRRSLGFALANAAVIAAYTWIDGIGVRRSGNALAYASWIFVLDALPLLALALATRRSAVIRHARSGWARGCIAGAFTVGAYALVLWAMAQAPIAAVAALRETSVVFGTLLATWRLREPLGTRRVAAAAVVAAGVALLER